MKRGALILMALAAAGVGCGQSITSPSRGCRRYATTLGYIKPDSLAQDVVHCIWAPPTYSCSDGRRWTYGSTDDFIDEARTPNRVLALSKEVYVSGGPMPGGSYTLTTDYEYDSQRRVVRLRDRRGSIAFDEWDGVGRPRVGTLKDRYSGVTTRVTVAYDDAARLMEDSTGEISGQDHNGNLIRDGSLEYVVTATADACK